MTVIIHATTQSISHLLLRVSCIGELDLIKAVVMAVVIVVFHGEMGDVDFDTGFATLTGEVNNTTHTIGILVNSEVTVLPIVDKIQSGT